MTRTDAIQKALAPLDLEAAVARYDRVIRRIAKDKRIRRRSAERRFTEMLKFLDLCAASSEPIAPPPKVDDAWHVFVLFTREYAGYCERRFGFFLHHDPTETRDQEAYARAYEMVTARFNPPDRRVWHAPYSGGGFWGGCGGGGCGGGCGGGGG